MTRVKKKMVDIQKNKTWKIAAAFSTYEEANDFKKQLHEKCTEVKIKRGSKFNNGRKQEIFRVKCWNPQLKEKKVEKEKVAKAKFKKGKTQRS